MEVYEKINVILKRKKITKRKFSEMLRNLEPRLKSTDQAPIETTIYKYLNGSVNIPIELITYIAETLDITEQELFDDSLKTKIKYLKHISKDSDQKEIEYLNKFIYSNNEQINITGHKQNIQKLISLLIYAPDIMIDNIIQKLEDIEAIYATI